MTKQVIVGIISNNESSEKYLLVNSTRDFGEFTGFFYPPGGHIEEHEDDKTALIREIKEELGLEVQPLIEIATTGGDVLDQITHWWECRIVGNSTIKSHKDEIRDTKWFSKDEILNSDVIWPATQKFFKNIFNIS